MRTFGRPAPAPRVREVSMRSLVDSGADLAGLLQQCQLELRL
jgi:hypothetical protein